MLAWCLFLIYGTEHLQWLKHHNRTYRQINQLEIEYTYRNTDKRMYKRVYHTFKNFVSKLPTNWPPRNIDLSNTINQNDWNMITKFSTIRVRYYFPLWWGHYQNERHLIKRASLSIYEMFFFLIGYLKSCGF